MHKIFVGGEMAYLQHKTLQLITIQSKSFPIIKYFIRLIFGLQPEWEAVLYKFHFLVYSLHWQPSGSVPRLEICLKSICIYCV